MNGSLPRPHERIELGERGDVLIFDEETRAHAQGSYDAAWTAVCSQDIQYMAWRFSEVEGGGLTVSATAKKARNAHMGDVYPALVDGHFHGNTGYECGYLGSGPANLSYSLLLHATGSVAIAQKFAQDFKEDVIALLPRGLDIINGREASPKHTRHVWSLTRSMILGYVEAALSREHRKHPEADDDGDEQKFLNAVTVEELAALDAACDHYKSDEEQEYSE